MEKTKRRWAWTSKNLRKTQSKENCINKKTKFSYKFLKKKYRSWRVNRRYLKSQTNKLNLFNYYEEDTPFFRYEDHDYLSDDHLMVMLDRGEITYEEYCLMDHENQSDLLITYDYRHCLDYTTSLKKCSDAIDMGLKQHKRDFGFYEVPWW